MAFDDYIRPVSTVNSRLGERPLARPLIASISPVGPGSEETCSGTGSTRRTGTISARRRTRVMIQAGEEIHVRGGQRMRVVAVVPFEEEDESPFVGLLQVEAA
jgi:hypothetical protein